MKQTTKATELLRRPTPTSPRTSFLFPAKQQQNKPPISSSSAARSCRRRARWPITSNDIFKISDGGPDCLSATSFCQYSTTCLTPTGGSVWPPTGRISSGTPAPLRPPRSAEQRQAASLRQLADRQLYVSSPDGWNPRE